MKTSSNKIIRRLNLRSLFSPLCHPPHPLLSLSLYRISLIYFCILIEKLETGMLANTLLVNLSYNPHSLGNTARIHISCSMASR